MIIYGPVDSWRLGKSLGIDLIYSKKTCSFDCIYCQLGKTMHKTAERKIFVNDNIAKNELDRFPWNDFAIDFITFSGMGEPTLAKNLGNVAKYAKKFGKPIAILTNSSLFSYKDVQKDLENIDWVIAKLDAPNEKIFKKINRPYESIKFDEMVDAIKEVAAKAKKFSLQVMFVEENKRCAKDIASLAKEIEADEIQINTPLRKSPVAPLSKEELFKIEEKFEGLNTINVYSSPRPKVKPLDYEEVRRRRP